MDCTPFIRTKGHLTAWLVIPVILVALIVLSTRSFYARQKASHEQKQALSELMPKLVTERTAAQSFLKPYRIELGSEISVQGVYMSRINRLAARTSLAVSAINFEQMPIDPTLGTARLTIKLQGTGSCRQIADFLNRLKKEDPLLYESKLSISPVGGRSKLLKINAELTRMHIK